MARTLHPPPDMARRGMGGKEEGEEPCARAADAAAALRTCWTEVEDDLMGRGGGLAAQILFDPRLRPVQPILEPVVGLFFPSIFLEKFYTN